MTTVTAVIAVTTVTGFFGAAIGRAIGGGSVRGAGSPPGPGPGNLAGN